MNNGNAVYKGIGPEEGKVIAKEDAYRYALERCLSGKLEEQAEFREMLEKWYFDGNWYLEQEA